MSVIALLTDFGTRDAYVAEMKGMILQINPKATLVDVTHEISPQDLVHASYVLRHCLPYFPAGTIFVAVVDPGVGTPRRILAMRFSGRVVLAPDNGLVTLVHRDAELQEIRIVENRRFFAHTLSATFHGRDIFAPVAGHISLGLSLDHLGPVADQLDILDLRKAHRDEAGVIHGEVVYIDHFGNLVTNISTVDISAANVGRHALEVFLGDQTVGPIRVTYSDAAAGEPLALIGSTDQLEISVNKGHAANQLQAGRGMPVRVS
jgi:hypothetical protein